MRITNFLFLVIHIVIIDHCLKVFAVIKKTTSIPETTNQPNSAQIFEDYLKNSDRFTRSTPLDEIALTSSTKILQINNIENTIVPETTAKAIVDENFTPFKTKNRALDGQNSINDVQHTSTTRTTIDQLVESSKSNNTVQSFSTDYPFLLVNYTESFSNIGHPPTTTTISFIENNKEYSTSENLGESKDNKSTNFTVSPILEEQNLFPFIVKKTTKYTTRKNLVHLTVEDDLEISDVFSRSTPSDEIALSSSTKILEINKAENTIHPETTTNTVADENLSSSRNKNRAQEGQNATGDVKYISTTQTNVNQIVLSAKSDNTTKSFSTDSPSILTNHTKISSSLGYLGSTTSVSFIESKIEQSTCKNLVESKDNKLTNVTESPTLEEPTLFSFIVKATTEYLSRDDLAHSNDIYSTFQTESKTVSQTSADKLISPRNVRNTSNLSSNPVTYSNSLKLENFSTVESTSGVFGGQTFNHLSQNISASEKIGITFAASTKSGRIRTTSSIGLIILKAITNYSTPESLADTKTPKYLSTQIISLPVINKIDEVTTAETNIENNSTGNFLSRRLTNEITTSSIIETHSSRVSKAHSILLTNLLKSSTRIYSTTEDTIVLNSLTPKISNRMGEEENDDTSPGELIFSGFKVFVTVIGLLANLATLLTLIVNKTTFSTRTLLINQAFIDAIVCLLGLLIYTQSFNSMTNNNTINFLLCHVWQSQAMYWGAVLLSVWNVVFIALDRFQIINARGGPQMIRRRGRKISITIMYVASVFFQIPAYLQVQYDQNTGKCEDWMTISTNDDLFVKFMIFYGYGWFFTMYIVPIGCLIGMYGEIILYLRRNKQTLRELLDKRSSITLDTTDRQVTQMAITIAIVFILSLSWDAFYCLFGFTGLTPYEFNSTLQTTGVFLATIDSCATPFIYAFTMSKFRADLKATFFGDFTWCPNVLCCFGNWKEPEVTPPVFLPSDSRNIPSMEELDRIRDFFNPNNPDFSTESSRRATVRFQTNTKMVQYMNKLKHKNNSDESSSQTKSNNSGVENRSFDSNC